MILKNKFSIIIALIILFLSLAGPGTFDKVPFFEFRFFDKVAHLGMYFGFMSVFIFENRKTVKNNRHLYLLGLIPFSYGVLMEILQITVASGRSGSFFDVLFNTAGIFISIHVWIRIEPKINEIFR
jgi:VanZ family protein